MLDDTTLNQLTLFVEDSHVKTYRWPDAAQDWLESDRDYGMSSIAFLQSVGQDGLSLRMSPVCYPVTKGRTLPLSFRGWSNSGMASPGGFLTLSLPEWHSDAAVCSLSDILETDVPQKYYLSARAARGILRRAEKRDKVLPETLRVALCTLARQDEMQATPETDT